MFLHLPNAFGDPPTNMAVDTALPAALPEGAAVFRHYGWTEPAATFGYAQKIDDVRRAAPDTVRLCRRLTGGGIVDHRDDWTYALVLQAALPAVREPATRLYATLHACLRDTLADLGIAAELAPCPRHCGESPATAAAADQCFIRAAANDVVRPDGPKIAGAAMRRSREGLLVQGSVAREALPTDFDWTTFADALPKNLANALGLQAHTPEDLRPLFDGQRIEEEKRRFADPAWTARR